MENYEKLLSADPIGAFLKMDDNYCRYFNIAYKVNSHSPGVDEERKSRLKENDSLTKAPFLELLPEYEQVDSNELKAFRARLSRAFGSEDVADGFLKFIEAGLMSYMPYGHQVEMLDEAFVKQQNTVITSGTGSGKTESFLLPLLAQIFKEGKTEWNTTPQYSKQWYLAGNGHYKPSQRANEGREKAIRALVLYPMNALVSDQMARLREALDSDKVRTFLDSKDGLNGNRIFFGSYNGATIGRRSYEQVSALPAVQRNAYTKEVSDNLKNFETHFSRIKEYASQKPDALFVSPRISSDAFTSEMVTRWDMQVAPPDILVTNVSMLSIMLMREAEKNIFAQTKKWLENNPKHVFHIVIDELHLYRGTAGSETACLIRMLLRTIGLPPYKNGKPNPQLRVLSSSASLGDDDQTEKFLEEFFGVYNDDKSPAFSIVKGSEYNPQKANSLDYQIFSKFDNTFVGLSDDEKRIRLDSFAKDYGCDNISAFVRKYQETIYSDIKSIIPRNPNGSLRAISIDDLCNEHNGVQLFKSKEAMRGFFIFRGAIDKTGIIHRLPRLRFHKFYKYIEGLWGELQPTSKSQHKSPVHNLSYVAHEIGPDKCKVLELLRCETCGELFIGGNRKNINESTYLTLNYPNLNKIPNTSPTPMVQNKSYADYALFWPTNKSITNEPHDRIAHMFDSKTSGGVHWKHCYLNVYTGAIEDKNESENLIEGYLLDVTVNVKKGSLLSALPCRCPNCNQDFQHRKYTKSPIRSFRTGIRRSNELLSKELMYQLDGKKPKLIGFSDSREDAAQQAYGIELENYRDMVRMVFIQSIDEASNSLDDIKNKISQGLNNGMKKSDVRKLINNQFSNVPHISDIIDCIFDDDDKELAKYASYMNQFIDLDRFVGNNLDGVVVRKLLQLGINPAGPESKYQHYELQGQQGLKDWSTAFDFDRGCMKKDLLGQTFKGYFSRDNIKQRLEATIYSCSFGKYMGVSCLDSGMGYIGCKHSDEAKDSNEYKVLNGILSSCGINTFDFIDAFIRILGDNHRYTDPDEPYEQVDWNSYDDFSKTLKSPIKEFAESNRVNEVELGNALFNFLESFVSGTSTYLLFNKLAFHRMKGTDKYYKCPKCGRIHPNRGFGFCTNTCCMEGLPDTESGLARELYEHYISYDIKVEPRQARRLHTEEITGQTDDIQKRLLNFKDIVLPEDNIASNEKGYELTMPIDMASVTTTMEVGVDIGSLQAIFQGNMPPTRYNYQQRVGRGGRRGQAFSAAVTFCRGRSHDNYYYNKATEEMVGGMPAAPELSLAPFFDVDDNGVRHYHMKQAIMKRVVVKDVLNLAIHKYEPELNDTSGEFGSVAEWQNETRNKLETWIADNNNKELISNIVNFYFSQFNQPQLGVDITVDIKKINNWICNNLITDIDSAVEAETNIDKGLAQCLTERGLLPMYGMPSDIRLFYHGLDTAKHELKSISRSSDMAITEFAPGQEKTKDKGVYRIDDVTIPMKCNSNGGKNDITFLDSSGDALSARFIISYDKDVTDDNRDSLSITNIEPADPNADIVSLNNSIFPNQKILVIPHAYTSEKLKGNNGAAQDNNDRRGNFIERDIFAKDDPLNENKKDVRNVLISSYGLGDNPDSEVWHINAKNNFFYSGHYASHRDIHLPNGVVNDKQVFAFNEQPTNDNVELALGSRKVTEMIKLQLNKYSEHLDLNVETGNSSAIRAAFYSAAFLLQRCLADRLDVQPEEIEISSKIDPETHMPIIYLNDSLANGAGIVGYLYQENHFEEMVDEIINFKTKFMKSLIDDGHRKSCLTACQNCLLTFSNRGFHHILDWRLGVGILHLMKDPSYDFGYEKKDALELQDANEIIQDCAKKLSLDLASDEWYKEQLIRNGLITKKHLNVIYHPLWKKEAVLGLIPNVQRYGNEISMYNTFRVLRSDLEEDVTPDLKNIIVVPQNQSDRIKPHILLE